VPSFALKLVLGEFSQEVLGSVRVIPKVLMSAGFEFKDPDIVSAVKTL
jgi:NAD dependent epimerase/dehydratase family enzyme